LGSRADQQQLVSLADAGLATVIVAPPTIAVSAIKIAANRRLLI
jgi:hypothetical protein